MSDSFIRAMLFLFNNSMTNDDTILAQFVNMVENNDAITLLQNCNVNEACIESALSIKDNISKTNIIDHQCIIALFRQYGYDVDNGNGQLNICEIIKLMLECIQNRENKLV